MVSIDRVFFKDIPLNIVSNGFSVPSTHVPGKRDIIQIFSTLLGHLQARGQICGSGA